MVLGKPSFCAGVRPVFIKVSSFVVSLHDGDQSEDRWIASARVDARWTFVQAAWGEKRVTLGYTLANEAQTAATRRDESPDIVRLVLGDASELEGDRADQCLCYAVTLAIDLSRRVIEFTGSVVGLPPIFYAMTAHGVAAASDIRTLIQLPGVISHLDANSVSDVFRFGYPLHSRTMFRQVAMLTAGYRLAIYADGHSRRAKSWNLPDETSALGQRDLLALQVENFRQAIRAASANEAFLSLTAGLDTRAILAALIADGQRIPACTLTGPNRSIDSRAAQALCNHYGWPHVDAVLDDRFLSDLPRYVLDASKLSGGITSLGQAHEVYFYRTVAQLGRYRISGNVGNQLGRFGMEGASLRNGDITVLAPALGVDASSARGHHWLDKALSDAGGRALGVLLQQEVPFALVANYSIGQSFATQMSPYAKGAVIESAMTASLCNRDRSYSQPATRFRDVKYRFLGPSRTRSFQCALVAASGGYVAKRPVNWGGG